MPETETCVSFNLNIKLMEIVGCVANINAHLQVKETKNNILLNNTNKIENVNFKFKKGLKFLDLIIHKFMRTHYLLWVRLFFMNAFNLS